MAPESLPPFAGSAADVGEDFRRLEEKIREQRQSLDELREIQALSRTIRGASSPEEILVGLGGILERILPEPELGLFLQQGEELAAVGDPSLGLRDTVFALQEDGIVGWVLEEQRPVSVPRLDDASAEKNDLLVPLIVMNAGIGVLLVRSLQQEEELTSQQLELISFAAWQAAIALENARLLRHLEESRRQLQDMIDGASDLILLVDEEARITYANSRTTWLGEPREHLTGRSLLEFIQDAEAGASLAEGIRQRRRDLHELELRNLAVEGHEPVVAQLSLSPLLPAHSGEAVCLIILRDLTESRAAEERAREAETLQAVMLAAVTVNHEINNPLTAIVGNLYLLRRELEDRAPELLPRIDLAERSARQIEEVARKLEQVSSVRRVRYLGETDMLDLEPGPPAVDGEDPAPDPAASGKERP